MSIEVCCALCGDRLTEPGAILLSPPKMDGSVDKYHLCVDCYAEKVVVH